jgi:hypothetical protein
VLAGATNIILRNDTTISKVKYRVREYNPTSDQQGSHSFFAEAVINNEITNNELAEKIAARTGGNRHSHPQRRRTRTRW